MNVTIFFMAVVTIVSLVAYVRSLNNEPRVTAEDIIAVEEEWREMDELSRNFACNLYISLGRNDFLDVAMSEGQSKAMAEVKADIFERDCVGY